MDQIVMKELIEFIEKHLSDAPFEMYEAEYVLHSEDVLHNEIEDFIRHTRKPSFAEVLFQFIDSKELSDIEIYKKARMDRRHFSKIRSNPDYRLSKRTAIALAFALELTKEETETLLLVAGFSLSDHDTFDLVIQFCLEKKLYDLDTVNEALEYFSLKPFA